MSKQIRVSDAIHSEIDRMIKKYKMDRKSLVNSAIVMLKCILENDPKFIDLTTNDGEKIRIPSPIIVNKTTKEDK